MTDPKAYKKKLDGILPRGRLRASASTVDEAKQLKKDLTQIQKELRQVKREIALDMKLIRGEYRDKSSSAAAGTSTVLSIMGKRRAAGSARASAKRKLSKDRDKKLAPYESLKRYIDDLIIQADKAKVQIDKYIADNRA